MRFNFPGKLPGEVIIAEYREPSHYDYFLYLYMNILNWFHIVFWLGF